MEAEVKDVDLPIIGPDEMLIKVEAAGICGSDLEIYEATLPIPITLPRIIGHEFSGIAEQIGERVDKSNLGVGDRVVSESGMTVAPSLARTMQTAFPIPRPAPVTRQTLFVSFILDTSNTF